MGITHHWEAVDFLVQKCSLSLHEFYKTEYTSYDFTSCLMILVEDVLRILTKTGNATKYFC